MSTQKVNENDLVQAARLRYEARKPWKDCAEEIGITDRQLRNIRKTPGWADAVAEIVAEFEQDAIPIAISYLIHEIESKGKDAIQAAKALIDAYKAAKLEITGKGGGPVELAWWGGIEDAQAKDNGDSDSSEPEDTSRDS